MIITGIHFIARHQPDDLQEMNIWDKHELNFTDDKMYADLVWDVELNFPLLGLMGHDI